MKSKKMKFAAPLPSDLPGPNESEESFIDRMGATGNGVALALYREARGSGYSHEYVTEGGYAFCLGDRADEIRAEYA
jgi:hypothetical protein